MKEKKVEQSKKYTAIKIIIPLTACVIGVGLAFFIDKKKKAVDFSEFSSINAICELATLKSFYNNVINYDKEAEGAEKVLDVFLWPFIDIKQQQYWLEYTGVVETGIDGSQVRIDKDDNGVVKVFVPDAEVFNVQADEASLTNPVTDKGIISISGKEKSEAFSAAQKEMREEAEADKAMLRKAKENAKKLLEKYIINTGKQVGKEYTVEWVDSLE